MQPLKKTNMSKLFSLFMLFFFISLNLNSQSNKELISLTKTFLQTLNEDQLVETTYQFEDSLRYKWTNLPVGIVPRPGIQYGSLSDESRLAFHRLINRMLSSQGYLKITSIMKLDDILNVLIQEEFDNGRMNQTMLTRLQDLKWAHDNFYISFWGEPKIDQPWGMSFGGHHIALSLTAIGNTFSVSPLFLGTDPAEVRNGKYAGLRVLSKEEDYGFQLLNMLTESQQSKAILVQDVPRDIITNPNSSQRISSYYGISAKEFDNGQLEMLKILIEEYTHNFDHEIAHRIDEKIMNSGIESIYFAWIGSMEKHSPHYYIINTPDFLIEYDNSPNNGNHIHLILREKDSDFGEDLLKDHYLKSEHHIKE